MSNRIFLSSPTMHGDEQKFIKEAFDSNWVAPLGPNVDAFEREIAEFVGVKHAAALVSGTAALHLAVKLAGVKPGDIVFCSDLTFSATVNPVSYEGAVQVFIDSETETWNMNPEALEKAFEKYPNCKCVVVVNLYGTPAKLDEIKEICDRHGAVLIEDAAESLSATYKGKQTGTFGKYNALSFHAVKNLTTSEGGAVTWRDVDGLDNEWLYKQYMLISLHGQNKDAFSKNKPGDWEYDIEFLGYKCNMTDILAAIGLKQLERYSDILKRRKDIIEYYDKAFLPFGMQRLVHFDDISTSSGHLYLLRVPGIGERERNEIIHRMAERGVSCNVHYKPLPMHTAYRDLGFDIKDYPNAYKQYENEITLPLHTCLSDEDIMYIIEQYTEVLQSQTQRTLLR
jgi:dTDP-4-amino-4,6-dideoxygalactose transaminase